MTKRSIFNEDDMEWLFNELKHTKNYSHSNADNDFEITRINPIYYLGYILIKNKRYKDLIEFFEICKYDDCFYEDVSNVFHFNTENNFDALMYAIKYNITDILLIICKNINIHYSYCEIIIYYKNLYAFWEMIDCLTLNKLIYENFYCLEILNEEIKFYLNRYKWEDAEIITNNIIKAYNKN